MKKLKKILFGTGLLLMLVSIVIVVNPEPFLKFGYIGVFTFNLLSGPGMFIIPSLAQKMNVVWLAFFSSLGMAFNDSLAWIVGSSGSEILPKSKKIERIKESISKYGPIALLAWATIPFPYDLIGVIAGYLGIRFRYYFLPTFIGRFIRFLIIGSGSAALWEWFFH